jgi:hypothetical protein
MAERRRHAMMSNKEMLGRLLALSLLAVVVLGLTYMALRYASEIEAARQNGQSVFDLDKSPSEKEEEMEDRPDEDGFIPGEEDNNSEADDEEEGEGATPPSRPPLAGDEGVTPSREQ